MHATNCLNCDFALERSEAFCPSCGQKADTHRFTWSHFIHEFIHGFTHADKGLLYLLRGLATRPGAAIAEYVDGQRKRYFNPVTFLLLCIGFFVLTTTLFNSFGNVEELQKAEFNHLKTEKQRAVFLERQKRTAEVQTFRQKHPNMIAMVGLPLQAFLFWLFFRSRRRNYIEILIAVIFLGGFAQLMFSIFFSYPLSLVVSNPKLFFPFFGVVLLSMITYIAWGMRGFLSVDRQVSFIKTFLVGLLHFLLFASIVALISMWYMFSK